MAASLLASNSLFPRDVTSLKSLALFDLIVITVTLLAAFFDLRFRKIPNWLILFGLGAGLALNLHNGIGDTVLCILGFSLGIGILFFPFLLGWIGAGDVKYLGVIGALLGVGYLSRVLFYSTVAAGVMALGCVFIGRYQIRLFRDSWNEWKIFVMSFGRILPDTIGARVSKGAYSIPWGVALSVGTIAAYFFDSHGYWAGF